MKTIDNLFGLGSILFALGISLLPKFADSGNVELPMELRGYVLPNESVSEIDSVFTYSQNGRLLSKSGLFYVHDEDAFGNEVYLPNGYRLVVPTDNPSTTEIEGAQNGEVLNFYGKDNEHSSWVYHLNPIQGEVVHEWGKIKRIDFDVGPVGVEDDFHSGLPNGYKLFQNYPNPFNSATTIKYELPRRGDIDLSIYDVNGRKIKTLVDGVRSAGEHEINFDFDGFSSGIYFYLLKTPKGDFSKKMVFLK